MSLSFFFSHGSEYVFIYVTFLFALLFAFIFFFLSKIFTKSKRPLLPPGPKPWPIVGNLPEMWRKKPRYRWLHSLMKELNTEIACVRLGSVYVVPVTSPEIAMEFLRQHDAVTASRPITVTTSMFSDGFLTAAFAPWGKQWKKMRKVLTHEILNPTRLEWLRSKRKEEADNLLRVVNNICKSGSVVDVRLVSQHFTGNIMRRMMFNRRYYRQGREDGGPCVEEQEHIKALFTVLLYVYALCVSDYLPILKPLDLDGHEKTVRNALNVIKKYEDPIINERVEMWKEGKRTEPEDLLDVFISVKDDNGKPLLSVAEIKAQITVIYFDI